MVKIVTPIKSFYQGTEGFDPTAESVIEIYDDNVLEYIGMVLFLNKTPCLILVSALDTSGGPWLRDFHEFLAYPPRKWKYASLKLAEMHFTPL